MMDGRRLGVRRSPPRLGEHSRELLLALGYDEAGIAALCDAGATQVE